MHLHFDKPGEEAARRAIVATRTQAQAVPVASVAERKASPGSVADLQRTVGNAAVVQLLQDDEEAEGGAHAGGDGAPAPERSPVLDVVGRGGGEPLPPSLRGGMETSLGVDLGDVRVHTDASAASSAHSVQASAYTVGNDVVFAAGQYDPASATGQRTLAHELTHVVQQRSGPVAGTPTGDGISLSDPTDSFERAAEANADRVISGAPSATSSSTGPAGAQREVAGAEPLEDEEAVQGLWAQRQVAPEEEEEEPTTA
jgi:hypothetical protein